MSGTDAPAIWTPPSRRVDQRTRPAGDLVHDRRKARAPSRLVGRRGRRRAAAVACGALGLSVLVPGAGFAETPAGQSARTYRNLSDDQATATARQQFPWFLNAPPLRWPAADIEAQLKGYLGDRTAIVGRGAGRRGLVESSVPLRGKTPDGRDAELDLGLVDADSSSFAPKSAAAAVRIPARSDGALRFPDRSFGLRLEGARPQAATISQNKAFFANVADDSDLVLEPGPQGAELSVILRSPAAPTEIPLRLDLAAGQKLRTGDGTGDGPPAGSVELLEGEQRAAVIFPASAVDAEGKAVPVSYRLDGTRLVMQLTVSADAVYPVLVDPTIGVYDSNGNSAGAGTTGYTWPGWYPVAYTPNQDTTGTTWSYCNNQAANLNKKFYFCQGNLSGASWTGGPLYIKANGTQSYVQDYYAQWVKDARPDAYIYRLDAAGLANVGSYQAHLVVGVRKADGSNWEDGGVLWGNGVDTSRGAITSLSAAYRTEEGMALQWATRYLFVHSPDLAHVSPAPVDPITPGNRAMLRMVMDAGPPGTPLPFVQLDGAATLSSETYAPSLSTPTHTTAVPSGWVDSYSDSVSTTATDRGLGMGQIVASGPNLSATTTGCATPGSGNAQNLYDSCPLSLTLPSTTYTAPEGSNTYKVSATDLVTNRDTAQDKTWQVKVDRSVPTAQLSGPLWDDRNFVDADGTEDIGYVSADEALQVDSSDGSSTSPRSGVASIEMTVDGRRVRPEDVYTQSCTSSGCPYTGSHQFTFHSSDFTEGDHKVAMIVRDQLANPTGTTGDTHTTVREFWVHVGPPESDPQESTETYLPPPPDTNPNAAPSADDSNTPFVDPLTAPQASQAQLDVQRDAINPLADLNHVLGLTGYTVQEIGVLTQGEDPVTEKQINIGATMILTLTSPKDISTTVPSWRPPWPGTAEYVPFRAQLVASGVTDLFVDIDLRTDTLIDIRPGPTSDATTFAPLPGTPPLPPEPRED